MIRQKIELKETEIESNIVTGGNNQASTDNNSVNTSVAIPEKHTVFTAYTYNDLD